VLPEVGEFGGRDDPPEGWEDHGVLAGLVRLVGAPGCREGAGGENQPPSFLQLLEQLPGRLGHVVWQRRGQRLETELAEGSPELRGQRTVTLDMQQPCRPRPEHQRTPQPLVLPSGNDGHLVRTRQRPGDRPQLLLRGVAATADQGTKPTGR